MSEAEGQMQRPSPRDPWIGQRLGDKRQVEILRLIGTGGMGSVYLGRDDEEGCPVAVKLLRMEYQATREEMRRFIREGRRFARLRHPSIVDVRYLGWVEGLPYIVSEYVEGSNLYELLVYSGPLPVKNAFSICRDVAAGLGEAHRHRVIHRDLKPENIMIRERDHAVKVLDFGIAKDLDSASELTADGVYRGTPGYSAPEQIRGELIDERTDVFALGVILYEMLAGKAAFVGGDSLEVLRSSLRKTPIPVTRINQAVTTPAAALIDAMVEKEPGRRPGSMGEVIQRIEAVQAGLEAGCSEEEEEGIRAFLRRVFLRRPRGGRGG